MQDCPEQDEVLVCRAREGDREAEEALLRRYSNAVRARARKYFLVGGDTDDLTQEGLFGIYAAIGNYREDGGMSFKNFALLCATRRMYAALREGEKRGAESIDPEQLAGGESPEALLLDGEAWSEFFQRLSRHLSDFEYRVFVMYLSGMRYAEICTETGRDLKSVDNAIARSKKKLQSAYESQR